MKLPEPQAKEGKSIAEKGGKKLSRGAITKVVQYGPDAMYIQVIRHTGFDQDLCPLHISRSWADAPIVPRCCRLGQYEWSPDTESAVGASAGGHRAILNMFNIAQRRRPIGSRTCTTQLRVVINKTLSPYQPGSRTILYDSLVPTDTLRAIRPM